MSRTTGCGFPLLFPSAHQPSAAAASPASSHTRPAVTRPEPEMSPRLQDLECLNEDNALSELKKENLALFLQV